MKKEIKYNIEKFYKLDFITYTSFAQTIERIPGVKRVYDSTIEVDGYLLMAFKCDPYNVLLLCKGRHTLGDNVINELELWGGRNQIGEVEKLILQEHNKNYPRIRAGIGSNIIQV